MITTHVTIRDVARESGVSIKTVSRVINDEPYVRKELRDRVWKAVEELQYVPAEEGRRLASYKGGGDIRTGNVGFVMFPTYRKYTEPNFADLLEEMERAVVAENLHMYFTYTLKELENQSLFLKMVNPNVIDGCVFIGMGDRYLEDIRRIRSRIHNVVVLADYVNDPTISCIYADGSSAGYEGTKYLISLGHKRIACITGFLGFPGHYQIRILGYRKALQENGIAFDESLVREGKYDVEGARIAAASLLDGKQVPDAIFVVSDPMAIGVYKAIHERGLSIPDDISVISCDNIRMSAYLHPSLTTFAVDRVEMAASALRELYAQIDGKQKGGVKIIHPVQLVKRESCSSSR